MLTKVILDGEFGKVVGQKIWMLDCNSPAEALALIEANKAGIKKWIREHLKDYKICKVECESVNGEKESLTDETYSACRKCKTIRFLPIFTGAGGNNSVLQAIAGVAMIIVGAITYAYGGQALVSYGAGLIAAGAGMVLGAICTMLMSPSKNDDDDDNSNYYFNGAVNTTRQGNPVPLVFGRCRVGSAVISSEISVVEGTE